MSTPTKGAPLAVRLSAEQRAALEWQQSLFPQRFPSLFSVIQELSLNEVVEAYRTAMAGSTQAAS